MFVEQENDDILLLRKANNTAHGTGWQKGNMSGKSRLGISSIRLYRMVHDVGYQRADAEAV